MDDNVYAAEKIIAKRKIKGVTEYRISWKGYPPSANTWEPYDNILDKALIHEFENKKQALKSKKVAMENKRRASKINKPSKKAVRPVVCSEKPIIIEQQQQQEQEQDQELQLSDDEGSTKLMIVSPEPSRVTPQPAAENSRPVVEVNNKAPNFEPKKQIVEITRPVAETKHSVSVSPQPSVAASRSSFASPAPSTLSNQPPPPTPSPQQQHQHQQQHQQQQQHNHHHQQQQQQQHHQQQQQQQQQRQQPAIENNKPVLGFTKLVNEPTKSPQIDLPPQQHQQPQHQQPQHQQPQHQQPQQQQQPSFAARLLQHNPVTNNINSVSKIRRGASKFAIMNTIVTDVTVNDQTITISESKSPQCFFRDVERNSIAVDATYFADNQNNRADD